MAEYDVSELDIGGRVMTMDPDRAIWYCCRQRAGPLVKECRALRPRFRPGESAFDHRAKAELKRDQRSAVSRKAVDRLEIRLALLGPTGTHYTLTYEDEHLPGDFSGVRRSLRAFLARVGRWRDGRPLDYAYAIEGLHGDHRYHIHFACPYEDLAPAEISRIWRQGAVDDEPILLTHPIKDIVTGQWVTVCDGGYHK